MQIYFKSHSCHCLTERFIVTEQIKKASILVITISVCRSCIIHKGKRESMTRYKVHLFDFFQTQQHGACLKIRQTDLILWVIGWGAWAKGPGKGTGKTV